MIPVLRTQRRNVVNTKKRKRRNKAKQRKEKGEVKERKEGKRGKKKEKACNPYDKGARSMYLSIFKFRMDISTPARPKYSPSATRGNYSLKP